ncbi:hypothetical protein [Marinobacter halophilus]|uniref:Uncharacterized protein n=1 Tax=Marinobacter halophilus TaxID=1323740 RepID=A0A2T1KD10_9GAMM|nr:hypothetical protein [Marinobacter halophilus]PSF08011.1 hypothetical protein C7H08_11485 [Marinobacter halophilus]GGC58956.1 hypothetical protein GCM10011362_04260 [Marinobacter halophilus]
MKFPIVTVAMVSVALVYVFWGQTREQPDSTDPARFANLQANPVKISEAVDWAITQVPQICAQAVGDSDDDDAVAECIKRAQPRTSSCRRAVYDRFPDYVNSEALFRDVSISMMNCLVPQSGIVRP